MINKEKLIQERLNKPYEVGDVVYVQGLGSQNKKAWFRTAKITEIKEDGVYHDGSTYDHFASFDQIKHCTDDIGYNPFPKSRDLLRTVNYSLDSIIFMLTKEQQYEIGGIMTKAFNFDPFVYTPNGKKYYQRGEVWSLNAKQNLIRSITYGVNCGMVVIRNRSWQELENLVSKGETELGFKDVVDGKQRLLTIQQFVNSEFEVDGYYYDDWSEYAKNRFESNQCLGYGELPERTTDEQTIQQFLKLNIEGVPQSDEHIKKVKEIFNEFK